MALIICESFDGVGALANLVGKWTAAAGLITTGRHGNGWRANLNQQTIRYAFTAAEKDDYVVVGFAFKRNVYDGVREILNIASDANATEHLRFFTNASAGITVNRGTSTQIASTANNVLQGNIWQFIEIGVRISDSTSDFVLRIDGAVVPWNEGSGPFDTRNGGSAEVDNVEFFSTDASGQLISFDDIYILNEKTTDGFGNVSDLISFLGDVRVEALQPNGNGNSSQLDGSDGNSTDNYLLVDDVTPDDDTTYVQSDVNDEKDTYALENLASTSGSVAAIQIVTRARKTDTGSRSIAQVARSGGNELDSDDFALSSAYATQRTVMEKKPGGTAYSLADVNSAEAGAKVRP